MLNLTLPDTANVVNRARYHPPIGRRVHPDRVGPRPAAGIALAGDDARWSPRRGANDRGRHEPAAWHWLSWPTRRVGRRPRIGRGVTAVGRADTPVVPATNGIGSVCPDS